MIVTDEYYEGETVLMDEITCTYIQEPDCTEDREGEPQMIILSSRDGGGGKFIHIKTSGWSIDDVGSLKEIVDDFKHRMNDTFGSKPKDSNKDTKDN